METESIFPVGVDMAKASFDVCFQEENQPEQALVFANEPEGFRAFLSALPKGKNSKVVMEASGPYYYPLACFLYEQGLQVAVINPLVIRRFCQMKLQRAKTDRADARAIWQYGCAMQTPNWQPLAEAYLQIKQLYSHQQQLLKHQQACLRQREAFLASGKADSWLLTYMNKELIELAARLKELEEQLQQRIAQENGALQAQLQSIPGIGPKTSLLLIVSLRGFGGFTHYKQVIAYLGLAPRIYQSGSSVKGRSHICKMGMSSVRACLYMAARSARRYNRACKALYERLIARGKAHRQAMIAVVNKLLKQAFALVKSGEYYQPEYGLSLAEPKNILTPKP